MSLRLDHPMIQRLRARFERLYGDDVASRCVVRISEAFGRYGVAPRPEAAGRTWSERDVVLITYGDMATRAGEAPLATLGRFLAERVKDVVSVVHILPFFPYSSDDGFAVVDYHNVDPDLGAWRDVDRMRSDFDLMFDLVLNHCSSRSEWFYEYVRGIAPARDYFIEVDPSADLSQVVRPRATPLLRRVNTVHGERHVWATFSDDQIDLDFSNPDVLFEFLDILLFYVSQGVRILRLDAIAYLWKRIGTSCIHLPETHEVVKFFRDVLDIVAPEALILTETNVPHEENVSYFGNGDEARMVYQFTLPPLLLHALQTGTAEHLTKWASSLKAPPSGCTFFNFTASHDGVGVRPLEGVLDREEIDRMVERIEKLGGKVSTKANSDGTETPYELNITYLDALGDPEAPGGGDAFAKAERFLCSQTVALALQGVPGVYFNSLFAAPNDYDRRETTGRARAINRRKWKVEELDEHVADGKSAPGRIYREYKRRLAVRAESAALHPDSPQEAPNFSPKVFAVVRGWAEKTGRVVCLHNVSGDAVSVGGAKIAKALCVEQGPGIDLLRGRRVALDKPLKLKPWQCAWIAAGEPAQRKD